MRFTLKLILSILSLCLLFPSSGWAQRGRRVTLDLRDASVRQLFQQIESQTDYTFSYRDSEIEGLPSVTVHVRNADFEQVLKSELPGVSLQYKIVGNKIVITPLATTAPPQTIKGRVIDATGEGVVAAGVFIKGSTRGVVTDASGYYSITAPKNSVLVFSALGYSDQEVRVGQSSVVDVVLSDQYETLNEAVAIGYGTTSRKNLTTAISSIKVESVSKTANSNLSQLFMGKAAGLRANISSPQPGGAVDVSIRGAGSPIYIVDGVMVSDGELQVGHGTIEVPNSIRRAGLAGLNPGDIESVEILKDASAAIYGINAANGVILITTKKGAEGAPKVTVENSYSYVKNYKYLEPLNSQEYMNFSNIFSKEAYLLNHNMVPYGTNPYDGGWAPVYYPEEIEAATTTNWLDYILRDGHINNHSVSISGGTKKLNYYLSGNYFDQVGTVINSQMTRYTVRSNVSAQLFPFLKLTSILNINSNKYLNSNADGGGGGGIGKDALQTALAFPPYYQVYNEDGSFVRQRTMANPAEFYQYQDQSNTSGFGANFTGDVNLIKDILTFRTLFGYNHEEARRSLFIPSTLMWYEIVGTSRGHLGRNERSSRTLEGMMMYHQGFKDILTLDAVVGMGVYNQLGSSVDIDYKNANDIIAGDNLNAAEGPFIPTSGRWENEKRSQFGRFSVDLLDRYVLTGALRRDGTDKFFPDKKYAWFPSVSAAWKLSNEPFMKNISWLDLLKLRASYGVTGRDNLGTSLYGNYSASICYVRFDQNSTVFIPYIKSGSDYPDVTWEKTIMKNVGIDFHLLKSRVWGSFDLFRNDVTELLGTAPGEPLAMVGTRPVNYGHYFRSGWDATFNVIPIQKGAFSWTSQLTLTRYNMYWLERTENYDYQEYQLRDKEPMNANYFYHVTGIVNIDGSNIPASQRSLGEWACLPGYPIILDRNMDDIIDMRDIFLDDVLPQISIGFTNTFTYKNWDLDISAYGQFGATRYNYALSWANPGGLANYPAANSNQFAYWLWNSQTNPYGNKMAGVAIARGQSLPGNCGTDLGRQDASFVRIRNITLGYNLSGTSLGSMISQYVDKIRLYVDVQNPFIFTKFSGVDPEIYIGNSSSPAGYPMSRSFSVGARFNFK